MDEVWKKIDGYNEYSISTFGNIRRDNYRGLGYSKMLNFSSGSVSLSNNSKQRRLSISTLMRQNFKKESNTEEIWKKVFLDGFEYSVSNFGQVRNDKTERIMKLTKNQDMDKTGKKTNYFRYSVCLTKEGKSKNVKVSRLVATAFIPNPNNLPVVHHIDCNPLNNNVDNLAWVTVLENAQSKNKLRNIGGVRSIVGGFMADFIYYGKRYDFYNPNKYKCQDWLNARRVEIENNLNLTELDCHNKYKGYLDRDPKSKSITARITYKTKAYSFTNPNEDKCQDWLNARRIEIKYGLNLTEIDIRKKGNGSIYLTKSKTYSAEITIKGKLFRKTVKTREEGQKFIEECKKNNN